MIRIGLGHSVKLSASVYRFHQSRAKLWALCDDGTVWRIFCWRGFALALRSFTYHRSQHAN